MLELRKECQGAQVAHLGGGGKGHLKQNLWTVLDENIEVLKTLTFSSHVWCYSGADDNVIDDNSVTSPPASSSRRKLKCSCDIQNELPNEENPSHFYL